MFNSKREKILVSLVVLILIALVFGSMNSLATTITPSLTNNSATNNNSATVGATITASSGNTANNTNVPAVSSSVEGASNSNSNTNTNTNANTNTNTNSAGKALPYAGTNSSIVFVVIALIASALYAYKKVSDYNV